MKCQPVSLNRGSKSTKNRSHGNESCYGFSLIELLATVLIIMILFTLYWGGKSGNREKARQALCRQNLQKVYIALEIFSNDHAGKYPDQPGAKTSAEALDVLVPKYTADTSTFICPGSKDGALPGGESISKRRISYAYYMGRRAGNSPEALMTDRQVDTTSKVVNQQVFSSTGKPPGNNHKQFGGNILFCDGHAEACPANSAFSLVVPPGVVLLNP